MKSKGEQIYIGIQKVVFVILAVTSVFLSIGRRYDALKNRLNYRKVFGLVAVASALEGLETFVVLRWFRNRRKGK